MNQPAQTIPVTDKNNQYLYQLGKDKGINFHLLRDGTGYYKYPRYHLFGHDLSRPEIAINTNRPDWGNILVHEYGHHKQYKNRKVSRGRYKKLIDILYGGDNEDTVERIEWEREATRIGVDDMGKLYFNPEPVGST